jgi:CBS domain-containing protein
MSAVLDHVRVQDAMHHGILSCDLDAPLGEAAGIMSKHGVHAVAVNDGRTTRPIGVGSDLDIVAGLMSGDETSAARAAATEPLAVSADDRLARAARLMIEHGVSHLIVLDAASGQPVGILSTLDIIAAYIDGAEP